MENNKGKYIIIALLVGMTLILILVNFYLPTIAKFFEPMEQKTGEIALVPQIVDEENNIYKVEVKFKSGDDIELPKTVSVISFVLSYPTDENVPIRIVDQKGDPSQSVIPGPIISSEQWQIPVNNVIETETGVQIEFVAVNTTPRGFSTSNFVNVGTIYFQSEEALREDEFVLSFDTRYTGVYAKENAENIFNDESTLYYSIEK